MKRMRVALAVGLLAATILSGCVIVPVGERWHGERGYDREHEGGGYYQYHASLYHSYEHEDR